MRTSKAAGLPRARSLLAAAGLVLTLACAPAHAKRGLAIINTGDELFPVAEMPAEVVSASPEAKGVMAGYKCSHFGIFWADVWTWDCKLVAVMGDNSYADLPSEVNNKLVALPAFSISHAQRGVWNHYGVAMVVGALALFLVGGAALGRQRR